MPPAHAVSRAVLALLVVAIAGIVCLFAVDLQNWQQANEQLQQWWLALRHLIDGNDSSALGRR